MPDYGPPMPDSNGLGATGAIMGVKWLSGAFAGFMTDGAGLTLATGAAATSFFVLALAPVLWINTEMEKQKKIPEKQTHGKVNL